MAKKGIIWDLDGTLVNTANLHFAAWSCTLKEHGREFTQAEFARTFGRRNPEILAMLLGNDLAPATVAELGKQKEEFFRAAARVEGAILLPGVMKTVTELHAQGWQQAIGSSAPRENVQLLIELAGIAPYIAAFTSMEETQRGKPDPEVFLKAAGKIGILPGWCIVVEDAVFGVQAAKNAGMKCIAVRGGGQSNADDLRAAGADIIAETLNEVDPVIFERLLE